jgi:hypothetical protein
MDEYIVSLEQWQLMLKNEYNIIVNASHTNEQDEMLAWSIGMSFQYADVRKDVCDLSLFQLGNHSNMVLCAINDYTDERRRGNLEINRKNILKTLSANNINNTILDYSTYYKTLPKYKFIISPEGNGIDCHRHYEALMAGCIPIVEYSEYISEKYGDVPILYTKDYSEINEKYLEEVYERMSKKLYDFSRLFLNFFDKEIREQIIYCSRYWTIKLCGYVWYGDNYVPLNVHKVDTDETKTFSLAIPTMDRYDKYLKEYLPKYIKNKYINEIVICDENGEDYKKIQDEFGKCKKIKLFKNDSRLGVLKNKIKTLSLCSSDYIALIDSDNFVDESYFEEMIKYGTNQNTLLFPSKPMPSSDFSDFQWFNPINYNNWYFIVRSKKMFPVLNDGNGIYPKRFVELLTKLTITVEPHAADAFIQVQIAASLGFDICFTNASYIHTISENSAWLEMGEKSMEFIINNWNVGLLNFTKV